MECRSCLSQGSGMYFLSVCRDSKVHVRILSMSTTKLSAMNWAKADAGIVVVPSEMEEEVPQGLVRKSIVDERMFQRKTLYVLKDRPLSTVGEKIPGIFPAGSGSPGRYRRLGERLNPVIPVRRERTVRCRERYREQEV
jgi:hypothetical protein